MLSEGEICEGRTINPFCRVSSIDAISDASIVNLSIERKIRLIGLLVGSLLNTILSIGKSTTLRNQQNKNFVRNTPFPYRYRD